MDEAPKLRKRSEVGKARPGELFAEPPPGYPAGFAGSGSGPADEDIGNFAQVVKEAGFGFTLVDMARWGRQARDDVRRWIHGGGKGARPACLGAPENAQAARLDPEADEKPKTRLTARGKQDEVFVGRPADAYEVLDPGSGPKKGSTAEVAPPYPPSSQKPLADRSPESAPARAPSRKGPVPDSFLEQVRSALMAKGVHPSLADMWEWSRTQVDFAAAWVDQGGMLAMLPEWLDRHRVKNLVEVDGPEWEDDSLKPEKARKERRERMTAEANVQAMAGDGPQAADEEARRPKKETTKAKSERSDFERTPGGDINNCALANGDEEKGCQICKGKCPDQARLFARGLPPPGGAPEKPATIPASPEVNDDYKRFVLTVTSALDLEREYVELEEALEIGEEHRSYAVIAEHLDKAQRRAQRANGIWANAVIEHERLKLDQKEVDAALWKQAMERLEAEGGKTRIADVDAKIAELFPDEWREGKMRVKQSEVAVERAKSFQERWAQRERALVAALSACRK